MRATVSWSTAISYGMVFLVTGGILRAAPVSAAPVSGVLQCNAVIDRLFVRGLGEMVRCYRDVATAETCVAEVAASLATSAAQGCTEDAIAAMNSSARNSDDFGADLGAYAAVTAADLASRGEEARGLDNGEARRVLEIDARYFLGAKRLRDNARSVFLQHALDGRGPSVNVDRLATKLDALANRYVSKSTALGVETVNLRTAMPLLVTNPTCTQKIAADAYPLLVEPMLFSRAKNEQWWADEASQQQAIIGQWATIASNAMLVGSIYRQDGVAVFTSGGNILARELWGPVIGELYSTASDLIVDCIRGSVGGLSCTASILNHGISAVTGIINAYRINASAEASIATVAAAEVERFRVKYGRDDARIRAALGLAGSATSADVALAASRLTTPSNIDEVLQIVATADAVLNEKVRTLVGNCNATCSFRVVDTISGVTRPTDLAIGRDAAGASRLVVSDGVNGQAQTVRLWDRRVQRITFPSPFGNADENQTVVLGGVAMCAMGNLGSVQGGGLGGQIGKFDLAGTALFEVFPAGPDPKALVLVGDRVVSARYSCCGTPPNDTIRVHSATGTLLATATAGRGVLDLIYAPARNRLYAIAEIDERIDVLDATSFANLGQIPLPFSPLAGIVAGDQLFVVGVDGVQSPRIARVHLTTGNVHVLQPQAFGTPWDVTLVGGSLLVPIQERDEVLVVEAESLAVLGRVPVGDDPTSIVTETNSGVSYVANQGSDSVSAIACD